LQGFAPSAAQFRDGKSEAIERLQHECDGQNPVPMSATASASNQSDNSIVKWAMESSR
jgi:hypothetical protein